VAERSFHTRADDCARIARFFRVYGQSLALGRHTDPAGLGAIRPDLGSGLASLPNDRAGRQPPRDPASPAVAAKVPLRRSYSLKRSALPVKASILRTPLSGPIGRVKSRYSLNSIAM